MKAVVGRVGGRKTICIWHVCNEPASSRRRYLQHDHDACLGMHCWAVAATAESSATLRMAKSWIGWMAKGFACVGQVRLFTMHPGGAVEVCPAEVCAECQRSQRLFAEGHTHREVFVLFFAGPHTDAMGKVHVFIMLPLTSAGSGISRAWHRPQSIAMSWWKQKNIMGAKPVQE